MKSSEFITGSGWEVIADQSAIRAVAHYIARDCQPFIRANRISLLESEYLYRGVKAATPDQKFIKGDVRTNRNPRDTPKLWHQILDEFFMSKFNWPYRSASLFATTDIVTAIDYGKEYVIFPIGEYKMCYSPIISDMTIDLTGGLSLHATISPAINKLISSIPDNEIQQISKRYSLPYLDTASDLRGAIIDFNHYGVSDDNRNFPHFLVEYFLPKLGFTETQTYSDALSSEIMVHCQSYYGVYYNRRDPSDVNTLIRFILS